MLIDETTENDTLYSDILFFVLAFYNKRFYQI